MTFPKRMRPILATFLERQETLEFQASDENLAKMGEMIADMCEAAWAAALEEAAEKVCKYCQQGRKLVRGGTEHEPFPSGRVNCEAKDIRALASKGTT